jgi:dTDP-4-dehydrorhamnose 3,5-epimerase
MTPTNIPDVLMLKPKVFGDSRGFFFESVIEMDFAKVTGISVKFVQDNHIKDSQVSSFKDALVFL